MNSEVDVPTLGALGDNQLKKINNPAALMPDVYRELYTQTMHRAATHLRSWIETATQIRGIGIPRLSIVLGSGLSSLTTELEIIDRQRFLDCGLPSPSADGHAGEFLLANVAGRGVLLQSGRIHCYENWSPAVVALSARAQAIAGIRSFVLTNAAGTLEAGVSVGDLVLLTGHSGAHYHSPSNGLYDTDSEPVGPFGQKFYPVNDIYHPRLRQRFSEIARELNVSVHSGVYQFMPGPRYEEPNEIQHFIRQRKAALAENDRDNALIAVGMSTAPEAYALAQLRTNPAYQDIQILGISNITNKAAGLGGSVPTSEEVLTSGPIGGRKIAQILQKMAPEL